MRPLSATLGPFVVIVLLLGHLYIFALDRNNEAPYLTKDLGDERSRCRAAQSARPKEQALKGVTVDGKSTAGFSYLFYATSDEYACSALVNIERIRRVYHSILAVHVLISEEVTAHYITAFEGEGAVVHLHEIPRPNLHANDTSRAGNAYYRNCLLKLAAFQMHRISPGLKRILALDADQLILRNLDDLFTGIPPVDLAAPRAYWLSKDFIASTFLLIDLSDHLWDIVSNAIATVGQDEYDMDIVNNVFGEKVMMLSGEFVTLNSHWEDLELA